MSVTGSIVEPGVNGNVPDAFDDDENPNAPDVNILVYSERVCCAVAEVLIVINKYAVVALKLCEKPLNVTDVPA